MNKDVENAKAWYDKAAKDGSKEAADGLKRLNSAGALSMQDHNNIAVSRIKSVHGSQRGNRPPRLRQRPQHQLSTVQDEPEHSSTPPPRTSSAVPYPTDDRHGPSPYPDSRVNMPQGSGYGGARPPPNQYPPRGYASPPPGQYGQGPPPLRNSQTTPDMAGGRQQPYTPHRGSSVPASSGPYPPRPPKEAIQQGPPPGVSQRPPYAPPPQATPPPGQLPRPTMNSRPSFDSRPSQPPITGTPGPQGPGMLRPESARPDSRPSSRPSSSQGPPPGAPRPQAGRTPTPGHTNATTSPKPPASQPAPQQRPPGSGPKTFDAMNVPMAKKESDCVSCHIQSDGYKFLLIWYSL